MVMSRFDPLFFLNCMGHIRAYRIIAVVGMRHDSGKEIRASINKTAIVDGSRQYSL